MKRISLILSALMLLSFGLANGQSWVHVNDQTNFFAPNFINVGQEVTWTLRFHYEAPAPGENLTGASGGIKMYSPDGVSTWPAGNLTWLAGTVWTQFDAFNSTTTLILSGGGPGADTATFSGADFSPLSGSPTDGAEDDALKLQIPAPGFSAADTGKHFCLDTAFAPPGTEWLWGTQLGTPIIPDWGGGDQAANYTDGMGYCWELFVVPDLAPNVTSGCTDFGGSHCAIITHAFDAVDPDGDTVGLAWTVSSGPGSFSDGSGGHAVYSYQPTCADVAASPIAVTVNVAEGDGPNTDCSFNINVTNVAPVLTTGCGSVTPVGKGLTGEVDVNANAGDCDPVVWSLGSVSPAPVGSISIDQNGLVTFNTDDPGDGGILYTVEVIASDCAGAADTCEVQFDVLILTPFSVKIEKTHNTIQGQHEYVDVTLEGGSQELGGFDFVIGYDASALQFVGASIANSPFYQDCGWEYFTYRFSAFGNCNNACASGKLRVTGIAETNNGPNYADCFSVPLPAVLFTLDFLVSDNRTFECQYAPIRFVWFDCGDNTISNVLGDTLYISRDVYDYNNPNPIDDSTSNAYPTWLGAQLCNNPNPDKPDPVRFVDFFNGGIDIVCADSIDARGDINLNEIAYEIADAVLYSNYFIYGPPVFNINPAGQIAASDVNADGLTLSVADLVYLIRVVIGDANPYPKVAPTSIEATYTVASGEVSIDAEVAAAAIVVSGNANPVLLADNMNMISNFDGVNTRILVYTNADRGTVETFSGSFLGIEGNVISAEFATAEGGVVNSAAKLVPSTVVLNQNYPNPFNPSTTISFNLPSASKYTLTIYNITGQKVYEVTKTGKVGNNEEVWHADGASGVYFYKLETESSSLTKKMVFLK